MSTDRSRAEAGQRRVVAALWRLIGRSPTWSTGPPRHFAGDLNWQERVFVKHECLDDDPKSETGKRPMNLPAGLRADVEWHLAEFAEGGPNGRLFRGSHRGFPRRRNFNRIWRKALTVTGIPAGLGLHLHDLRHTGST